MLVYENNNYIVDTGESLILENGKVYRVINKMTSIVEVEEAMLPKCIDYAQQLDVGMTELMEQLNLYLEERTSH